MEKHARLYINLFRNTRNNIPIYTASYPTRLHNLGSNIGRWETKHGWKHWANQGYKSFPKI